VVRYLYNGGKGLTRAEIQDYQNNGLKIALVYEEDGTELLGGYAAGVRVARSARALADSLGIPAGAPIHFALDEDAQGANLAAAVEAIKGAVSVLGYNSVGGYGSFAFIEAIRGLCKYGWQTYAWSHGQVSSNATLYQYLNGQTVNGGSVDECRNLAEDFGAFNGTLGAGSAGSLTGSNTSGHSTVEVQQQLNRYGYKLVEDGIYGPATTGAAIAFQKGHGLTPDGIVGPITWAALVSGSSAAPVGHPAGPNLTVDGVWGALTTRAEQAALGVAVDGIRGPNTISAEQRKTGAHVDGIDGPDTRKHLQAYLGVAQDGVIGPITVRALQTRLNNHTF
jgi:peptidoglycan hydrolase-like protein with peptidoglycan-binding domain